MYKTIAVNLHDYVATNKNWEQLWADDDVAFWFERLNDDNTPKITSIKYMRQRHIETT